MTRTTKILITIFVSLFCITLMSISIFAAEDSDITLQGYQQTFVTDGKYSVRFIATGIDLDGVDAIGFEVFVGGKSIDRQGNVVYKSLSANYGADAITAESYGATYITGMAISGIPESLGAMQFTVNPYVVKDGVKIYGTSQSANVIPQKGVHVMPDGDGFTVDWAEKSDCVHNIVTVAGKDATCTETGLTDGQACSICNIFTVPQQIIEAKGHTEKTLEAVDPTYEQAGLTEGKQCTVCNVVTVPQEEIPMLVKKFELNIFDMPTGTYTPEKSLSITRGKTAYVTVLVSDWCESDAFTASITGTNASSASLSETEHEGTKLYSFTSTVTGIYTITFTSTADETITQTMLVRVEAVKSYSDAAQGKWINEQNGITLNFHPVNDDSGFAIMTISASSSQTPKSATTIVFTYKIVNGKFYATGSSSRYSLKISSTFNVMATIPIFKEYELTYVGASDPIPEGVELDADSINASKPIIGGSQYAHTTVSPVPETYSTTIKAGHTVYFDLIEYANTSFSYTITLTFEGDVLMYVDEDNVNPVESGLTFTLNRTNYIKSFCFYNESGADLQITFTISIE